jgi:GH18 family chitinase/lysophospholipase L1-like esterase
MKENRHRRGIIRSSLSQPLLFLAVGFCLTAGTCPGGIISCLGDSVTRGYPYSDNGNPQDTYPARLLNRLESEYGPGNFTVYNHGVNGYQAQDVVDDLEGADSLAEDPDYVLLMIGGNDLAGADYSTIFSIIEETTWEVQSCVDLVKSHVNAGGGHPRIIVSAFIFNLLEDGGGTAAVELYNTSLENNLSGYDLWFTANWDDFYNGDTSKARTELMFDNVHPNAAGYEVMAENWLEALRDLFATPTPAPSPSPAPAWPGGAGIEIGSGLDAGFEPSGIVWHQRLGALFIVGDGGEAVRMGEDGGGLNIWTPGGDLEGIAIADPETDYLYLGVEDPDSIREFDLAAGTLTEKSWTLTPWMAGAANSGLEALTFVPDGHHPYPDGTSGGLFYAGLQEDGKIYVFNVDLSGDEIVNYVDTIVPVPGRSDISGLHYHRETRTLYAVFDGSNLLREIKTDGTMIAEYHLPGNDQEGITLKPSCPSPVTSVFIAEDVGPEIWRYDGYPVACISASPTPTPRCDKIILGYYPYWNDGYRASQISYEKLTHICHAFVQPQADGSILTPAGPPPYLEPELLENAHAAGVKVLVSVGGYDTVADLNFRTIAADAGLRGEFAANLEAFCRIHGYDGADLDWEFPQDAGDRSNQNLLFQAVRETFNSASEPAPSWLLTMAISGGDWFGRWNDYTTLGGYVTFYNLMAYDCHGDWSGHMGHNAPLYRGGDPFDDASVEDALDYNLVTRGIPPEKIILGLPFYGYRWPTVEDLYETCSPCNATQESYREIAPLAGDGWTRVWDAAAEVPYLTADSGPGVISYDDVQSIAAKVGYALTDRGLRGVFAWEISGDYLAGEQPLLDQVQRSVLAACGLTPSPTVTIPSPSPTLPVATPTPSRTPAPLTTPSPPETATPSPLPIASPTPLPTIPPYQAVIDSGDYNGDGTAEIAVFRPSRGLWAIRNLTRVYFGKAGDLPIPGDYSGDGTSKISIFRPASGLWAIRGVTRVYFGRRGDIPVPGDYGGEGSTRIGIFRQENGLWAVKGLTRSYFGRADDRPVPGDYDGSGEKNIAVFRPVSGLWAVKGLTRLYYGRTEDIPVPGDYSGDGTDDPAIFRPSSGLWASRQMTRFYYGIWGDSPSVADYQGDNADHPGIFRPASGLWAIRGITRAYYGTTGDLPATR